MLSRLMTRREQALLFGLAAAILIGSAAIFWHRKNTEERNTANAARLVKAPENTALEKQPAEPAPAAALPPPEPVAAPEPAPPAESPGVAVAVTGPVRKPGLYRLDSDARVADLLSAAGGAVEDADLSDINLGARLIDGTTLTVPALPTAEREGNRMRFRRTAGPEIFNPPQYLRSAWQNSASAPAIAGETAAPAAAATAPQTTRKSGLLNLNTATQEEFESLPGIGPVLAGRIMEYRAHSPFSSVDDLQNVSGIGPKRLDSLRALVTVE